MTEGVESSDRRLNTQSSADSLHVPENIPTPQLPSVASGEEQLMFVLEPEKMFPEFH
jgi:hypothetical protein